MNTSDWKREDFVKVRALYEQALDTLSAPEKWAQGKFAQASKGDDTHLAGKP